MNIKEAKEEIRNTVRAYTAKNAEGLYRIPAVRQRPLLLIGPPGIGKTAIMEQIAAELHIGLVAYTITHHTRQSAIGLPVIRTREYQGESVQVTEYTMSEIIASVYNCMAETGLNEGILFIDEINCVSETLAPAMLEFLQCKRFGSHKVPEGWVIVAAGNPQGFNHSVRDFDLVTLDRVRLLNVEENLQVFCEFAVKAQVHPAILAFLEIKPQSFYRMEKHEGGTWFVTARGWEDLSGTLKVYEDLSLPVNEVLVEEFLQFPMIAREFYSFYVLFCRYGQKYPVGRILSASSLDHEAGEAKSCRQDFLQGLLLAGREEGISLIYLLYAECAGALSDSVGQEAGAGKLELAASLLLEMVEYAWRDGNLRKDPTCLKLLKTFRNLVETNQRTAVLPLRCSMPSYEKLVGLLDQEEEAGDYATVSEKLYRFVLGGEG